MTVNGEVKFPPKMLTVVPIAAAVGENPVIKGVVEMTKLLVLTLVPALVMTVIGPVTAPEGTVALTSVKATTLPWTEAFWPLKTTVVPFVTKFAPLMKTRVPAAPLGGEKPAMTGATCKLAALVAEAEAVSTCSGPLMAPTGMTNCN